MPDGCWRLLDRPCSSTKRARRGRDGAFCPCSGFPHCSSLLALLQSPGRVTFDTDLGLALNPLHLLHRAFHLWSADAGFGGVGDQTYGYLFPMGPFFALGHLAAIPEWLTQRLWCGLVLVVAYEGARRLTHRMVSPHPLVGVLAGVAWALSPRMLTVVGPFSSEAMPVALAPWLLLPLVTYLARDVRKAAWLSGLVVLFLGAANAGATVAVLPIPVLYLATRHHLLADPPAFVRLVVGRRGARLAVVGGSTPAARLVQPALHRLGGVGPHHH